ncbi:class I SAM-dependent methyltransferase [Streptosporangium sp. NPDC006930]|uniref:class I SAM-dependent methyltransferase n=1 Tax=unclassified Streptosporangium TaxID=2632669 RepID=UPI0034189358
MDLRDLPPPHRSRTSPTSLTVRDRFEWTRAAGIGPPPTVFGDLAGRRVVELGCGSGHNLAHLAIHHHAEGVGIDHDPLKIQRARTLYAGLPRLAFIRTDAAAYLRSRPPESIDLCLSIFGAFSFVERADLRPLLTAAACALRHGGRLALTLRATDTTDLVLIYTRS